jgi:nitrile hydratase accessory protein
MPQDLADATPLFAEPWEATAFALVVCLHRAGLFQWHEWVALLSVEIAAGPPDPTGARYYECWARALEALATRLGLVSPAALAGRCEAWRAAYLATPHGREVRLENAAGAA